MSEAENNMENKEERNAGLVTESGQQAPIAAKRIAAAAGVILLLLLVAATFVLACMDFNGKERVFSALLLCDIAIPVFLWFILRFLS